MIEQNVELQTKITILQVFILEDYVFLYGFEELCRRKKENPFLAYYSTKGMSHSPCLLPERYLKNSGFCYY